jgi:hypothetical protein
MRGKTRLTWLLTVGLALLPATVRGQEPVLPDPCLPPLLRQQLAETLDPANIRPLAVETSQPASTEPVATTPQELMALQVVRAQGADVGQPDFPIPVPIGHDRMDKGGIYFLGEFVMFKQTNPIGRQVIAVHGFVDEDGSMFGTPGQFIGSHTEALNAHDVSGPGTYQPGFKVGVGYKFEDASVIELNYMNLQKAVYNHSATLANKGFETGTPQFFKLEADTFLTAFVFNFPAAYAGPIAQSDGRPNKVAFGNAGATFGIWNAASEMSLEFDQRTSSMELRYRKPIFETECWRTYGLVGPRFFWIWERLKWRTVDLALDGSLNPTFAAIYTNITSNRMYGPFVGIGNEWYIGNGFALSLDLDVAGLLDIVKERASYELGEKDLPPINKRSITDYTLVPEFEGNLNIWYYPTEAIQLRFGFDAMAFFNTKGMVAPVSFDYGSLNPTYDRLFRWFNGLNAGIAIVF